MEILDSLLLALAFLGMILVLFTRFTKTGIFASLLGFAAYFYFFNDVGWLPIILSVVGLLLIVFEIFIPDFGLLGILGILSLGGGIYLTFGDLQTMILDVGLSVIITAIIVFLLFQNGHITNQWSRYVLHTEQESDKKTNKVSLHEEARQSIEAGQTATTSTPLRPSGKAIFDFKGQEIELDVITNGSHVDRHMPVFVEYVQGNKIIVKEVK